MATITDSFDRADSATALGTTSDGTATWVALLGTWGISSNQAYCATSDASSKNVAYLATSSGDGTVQVTVPNIIAAGIAFRIQDANNYLRFYNSAGTLFLFKKIAGTETQLASCGTVSAGDTLAVVFSGSSITVKKNGVTVGSGTETTLQAVTNHGLFIGAATPAAARFNDWSFVPPIPPARQPPHIVTASRAVPRAAVI